MIVEIFPNSKVYLKRYDTMIVKLELRGYNNKLIWKTMQKNLLYPNQMYQNKQKALNELRQILLTYNQPMQQ